MNEAKEMLDDPEMKELAEEEYYSSKDKLATVEEELKKIDVLNITPIEAINILIALKEKIK